MKIEISKPLASDGQAAPYDVVQVKKSLNRLGYYMPYERVGITGIPDQRMFDAIKSFQRMKGLRVTGQIRSGDETENAINAALLKPQEGFYIWRTVGDGKVRKSHAQYHGAVRAWSETPDPGEDFNCRCWAEVVQEGYFLPPRGLNILQSDYDPESQNFPDAINPTISPFDLWGGLILKGGLKIGTEVAILTVRILKQSPNLTKEQAKNLARFIKKIPSNSKESVKVTKLKNGDVKFTAVSKGKIPGSKAHYEKTINPKGEAVKYTKTTFGKNNEKIHTKDKMITKGEGNGIK